jgi:hypothetical protein
MSGLVFAAFFALNQMLATEGARTSLVTARFETFLGQGTNTLPFAMDDWAEAPGTVTIRLLNDCQEQASPLGDLLANDDVLFAGTCINRHQQSSRLVS